MAFKSVPAAAETLDDGAVVGPEPETEPEPERDEPLLLVRIMI